MKLRVFFLAAVLAAATCSLSAHASIAYGSLNNFDTVNDTGVECHGFEIELDDVHSTDITYTFDWNHYGAPKITEDNSNPLHPKVFVRYESGKKPDGSWAAYTAVPSGPISPTDGHMFTDPTVNFGGEHFGVGFYGSPSAVLYNWLIDDGAGNLVHGGAVNISTPTFVYYPPAVNQPAQVQAAIVVPKPEALPAKEFGEAMWVKVTVTQTHNAGQIELRDLVSDDPDDPDDENWMHGEPAEVEIEWFLMQTEFAKPDGGNNHELEGAPEELAEGDEIITRRYDFYKYAGPYDEETGEAMTDNVGADDLHGTGDYADVIVVGDYIGAQMAGFDPAGQLGLIDHLQDGALFEPYVDRLVVIGGVPPVETTVSGEMPDGMSLDVITGILSGTPTTAGLFSFTVHSLDANLGDVTKTYSLNIAASVVEQAFISTSASPVAGGSTSGDGAYDLGAIATVTAVASPGYSFANWTEGGVAVSNAASYAFTVTGDRALVANFTRVTYSIGVSAAPAAGGSASGGGTVNSGDSVTVLAVAAPNYRFVNWTEGGVAVSNAASYTFTASANRTLVANFAKITYAIAVSAAPAAGGSASGGGTYDSGSSVTVVAAASAGYQFVNWTEGGVAVSTSLSYTFTASGNRSLVANFALIPPLSYTVATSASPAAGGSTAGGGSYTGGSTATVTAVANAGYRFVSWMEGGFVVSTSASYTFPVNANRSLVAMFTPISTGVALKQLTIASPVFGGMSTVGVVCLAAPAPSGGAVVKLASAGPALVKVPATVYVPAGKTSALFSVGTSKVIKLTAVKVTATLGASQKATYVILAPFK